MLLVGYYLWDSKVFILPLLKNNIIRESIHEYACLHLIRQHRLMGCKDKTKALKREIIELPRKLESNTRIVPRCLLEVNGRYFKLLDFKNGNY